MQILEIYLVRKERPWRDNRFCSIVIGYRMSSASHGGEEQCAFQPGFRVFSVVVLPL
jgi:hypothetical protein